MAVPAGCERPHRRPVRCPADERTSPSARADSGVSARSMTRAHPRRASHPPPRPDAPAEVGATTDTSGRPLLLYVAGPDDVPGLGGHLPERRSSDERRGLCASGESTDDPDQCLTDGHDNAEFDARMDAPPQGLGNPGCQCPERNEPDQQKDDADTEAGRRNCPIGFDHLLFGHAPECREDSLRRPEPWSVGRLAGLGGTSRRGSDRSPCLLSGAPVAATAAARFRRASSRLTAPPFAGCNPRSRSRDTMCRCR